MSKQLPSAGAMSLTLNVAGSSTLLVAIFLSLLSSAVARPQTPPTTPSIWTIQIDESPAPPPEKGPPGSANALRDKAYVPIQVGSIFAAYFLTVIFISIALITVGRRLRRSAETSPKTLAMEIVRPGGQQGPPPAYSQSGAANPLSPTKSNWSNKTGWSGFRKHRKQDSMQGSVMTFDDSVIEDDRTRNEIEMDRLYAAVAEHEGTNTKGASRGPSANVSVAELPRSPPPQQQSYPQHQQSYPQHQQQLPEFQHLRGPAPPAFPLSPPPDPEEQPSRHGTASPRRQQTRPSPISVNGQPSGSPSRASSRSSLASATSFGKKRGINVRALPISPPMGSADLRPDAGQAYADSEPLSPRVYTPGPPPPTPPQARSMLQQQQQAYQQQQQIQQYQQQQAYGQQYQAQSPPPQQGYHQQGYHQQGYHQQVSQQRNPQGLHIDAHRAQAPATMRQEPIGSPHFNPSVRSSRSSVASSLQSPGLVASPRTATFAPPAIVEEPPSGSATPVSTTSRGAARAGKPAPLALGAHPGGNANGGAMGRSGTANNSQATLPLRALRSPNSLRPPSMIRANEVEVQPRRHAGPATGGLPMRTPITGVPQTPYSPYMPQTPLTPMTPSRLVGREERRKRKKEEGRRVLTAEDMVPEEDDQFGSAY